MFKNLWYNLVVVRKEINAMRKLSKFWYAKHFGYPLYDCELFRVQWLSNLRWGFHIGKPKCCTDAKWEIHIGPLYIVKKLEGNE